MATKFYCDGCDAEVREFGKGLGAKIRVVVEDAKSTFTVMDKQFDLCWGCAQTHAGWLDPTTWVRNAARRS